MSKGFVYILSNPELRSLLKIGWSVKVPTERIEELFTTGVPRPFVLEYYCLATDGAGLEARVHDKLRAYRISADREFFRVSLPLAVRTIESLGEIEHRWSRMQQPRSSPYSFARRSFRLEPNSPPRLAPKSCPRCRAVYYYSIYCPKCKVKLSA